MAVNDKGARDDLSSSKMKREPEMISAIRGGKVRRWHRGVKNGWS